MIKKKLSEAHPQMIHILNLAEKDFKIIVMNVINKIEEKMGKNR